MKNEEQELVEMEDGWEYEDARHARPKWDYFLPLSIFLSVLIFSGAWIYTASIAENQSRTSKTASAQVSPYEVVTPAAGVTIPVRWGDLGKKLVETGVIDERQFEALYASRGGLSLNMQALLDNADNGDLVITPQNAGVILNLLWAFGLGNRNPILENGPMRDPQYGDTANFASTGGWTLAAGGGMKHYSAHDFVVLTSDEQALVEKVAKNIYRPCCGNSTYFPDCNHGMAMLGLLELMASQGATENQMYRIALAVNSYWFPDTYLTIARYLESKGTKWPSVDPRGILGPQYSSAQGFAQIRRLVAPLPGAQTQGGCNVSGGQPIAPQPTSGGCGI